MMYSELHQNNSIFVVIDFQTKLLKIMDKKITSLISKNINLCLDTAQRLNIPTVATEHCLKSLGPTDPCIKLDKDIPIVQKTSFSCSRSSDFLEILSNKNNIILMGMEAHICVLETAIELKKNKFTPYVLIDSVQSSSKTKWKWGLEFMNKNGIKLLPTETLLFHLYQRADSDEFKAFAKKLKEYIN